MSIAVVGLGSAGRRHARNLLALGRSDLVLVRSGLGQAGPLEAPLDDLPSVATLDEAISGGVSAVVVANPTALHAATALRAVESGCHVLVEKPLAHELAGLDRLAAAAERSGAAVLIGYQFRFHPTLQRVRDLVANGGIGSLVAAEAHWGEYLPDWHPAEDYRLGYSARADLGGGVLRTLSHPIDYLRWIAGEVEVAAGLSGRGAGLDLDVDDTAAIALRFESGAVGSVTLNYSERPPRHEMRLVGTAGGVSWSAADGRATVRPVDADARTIEPPAGFERNDLFLAEMRHFLACAAGEESPACTIIDGVRALEVALAADRGV